MSTRFDIFKTLLNSTADTPVPKSIDTYGNFEIYFRPLDNYDFSNSSSIIINDSRIYKLINDSKDLHMYIKSINGVELNIAGESIRLPGVDYMLNRLMPMNSKNNITFDWLTTDIPFFEKFFIPWMEANTIQKIFPIIKMDLEIKFPKDLYKKFNIEDITYKYYGIRPVECGLHRMTNEPVTDFYRKITFDFDYFKVLYGGNTNLEN